MIQFLTEIPPFVIAAIISTAVLFLLLIASVLKRIWDALNDTAWLCNYIGHVVNDATLKAWQECRQNQTIPIGRQLVCERCNQVIDQQ